MYTNILLPTDGSALAGEGVAQGIRLAKALGARTTAVIVTEPVSAAALGAAAAALAAEISEINAKAKSAAQQRLRAVKDQAAQAGVACETVQIFDHTTPAQGILHAADERQCDLIVMASHGVGGLKRMFLGSQTFDVVTRASVPVLIVRVGARPTREASPLYSNILIATDGSELAQKGVDQGLSLAKRLDAMVTFVAVSGLAAGLGLEGLASFGLFETHANIMKATETAADIILNRCDQQAAAMGVRHEIIHMRKSEPAEAILACAQERKCDLIVMASHGYRGLERVLLGSQAYHVVVGASLPVLVVR